MDKMLSTTLLQFLIFVFVTLGGFYFLFSCCCRREKEKEEAARAEAQTHAPQQVVIVNANRQLDNCLNSSPINSSDNNPDTNSDANARRVSFIVDDSRPPSYQEAISGSFNA